MMLKKFALASAALLALVGARPAGAESLFYPSLVYRSGA